MEQNTEGYNLTGNNFIVTDDIKKHFDSFGYIIVRGLLDKEEIDKLKVFLEHDRGIQEHVVDKDDGEGRKASATVWNRPSNDITGIVASTEKLAGTWEKLLEGEVYHYHAKLIMKEAYTGGSFVWHQDYGYWYNNGCVWPNMGTTWIAIDKAGQSNGGLKIIPKSNTIGRIEHIRVGTQVGADTDRVDLISKVCPILQPELEPGDALFLHCNLLHRSDQNNSPNRRWGYLCCYNRADNSPTKSDSPHPVYSKLEQVPNSAIIECDTNVRNEERDYYKGVTKNSAFYSVQEKAK